MVLNQALMELLEAMLMDEGMELGGCCLSRNSLQELSYDLYRR